MLYAFAGSTHEDKSMYGADNRPGQPLFDCLSLLVMLLCDIAGKVKIKMIEIRYNAERESIIGKYLFLNDGAVLKKLIILSP